VSRCLHQLIEAQARRTPESPALKFEGDALTYAELDRRADSLAAHLVRLGAGPDVRIGLFIERSLEMVVALLGILKAGAAYVPIDPSYPEERIDFMLTDADVKVLLTQGTLVEKLPASRARIVCLDEFDWNGPGEARSRVEPRHLAYVIYTSGSTGHPKGVGIEHRNTVLFPALATGGCLHVVSQQRAENGSLLAEYFAREQIDVLKIVPSHFAALNPEGVMPRKRLILGGEASRLDWIERLRMLAPGCGIYNHYGPTETTVGVLTYHASGELPATPSGTLPLGKPLPNAEIRLVDGELWIGGAGVARGYLNRPELTAEKFAEGFYRTGDRARLLADGSYEFCGRVDHQVKVHGYRVELGEIEAALREHGAQDAVVLLREGELVAYLTPKEADASALREFLKARLPQYMVPSAFVLLEKLPLNANGKIDRQSLAALAVEAPAPSKNYIAPRSETEKAIAAIWRELLRVEQIGADDDVFDLGAQSLMAMKALARIREAFQVNLSLRNLFEHPTVAGLASAIDALTVLARPKPAQGEREEISL
jgi:acyl-CoA synthetase (AMP-forming)/AMP-acid ligase II/acyl carrier protein